MPSNSLGHGIFVPSMDLPGCALRPADDRRERIEYTMERIGSFVTLYREPSEQTEWSETTPKDFPARLASIDVAEIRCLFREAVPMSSRLDVHAPGRYCVYGK